MKKNIKIAILTLVLAILVCLIVYKIPNCIRNYQILNQIKEAGNNFFSSSNYQVITKDTLGHYNYIYYKDDISLVNIYTDDENELFDAYWENYSTGERVSLYQEIDKANGAYVEHNMIQYIKDLATLKLSNNSLFSIISEKDGCYVIKRKEKGWETLYDKKTGLPKKTHQLYKDKEITGTEFIFELNTVTDEMLEKPVPISAE